MFKLKNHIEIRPENRKRKPLVINNSHCEFTWQLRDTFSIFFSKELFSTKLHLCLSAGIFAHCVCACACILALVHLSTHMHVCIGLLEYSCLGDSQTHFRMFEQSYDSLDTGYLSFCLPLLRFPHSVDTGSG